MTTSPKVCTFELLKKLIALFLLVQILTNNAFVEELVKMPRLFTHYVHHAEEHQDTKGFMDYLHTHYAGQHENETHSKNHNDEDNDCNLPFKHCGSCYLSIHAPAVGLVTNILHADITYFQINDSGFVSANDQIESLDLQNIWQPPKLV